MAGRAPPFAALRVLEAACRHRSYKAAANELNITHSAISQAINRLEDQLGARLFERRGASMEPSAASLALAKAYSEATQALNHALRDLTAQDNANVLEVGLPSSIARLWLAPRLQRFQREFPGVQLSLKTDLRGGSDERLDVVIHSDALAPRLRHTTEFLTELADFPVCSRNFFMQQVIGSPQDLRRVPLLVDGDSAWEAWLEAAGVGVTTPLISLAFDDTALALDAAAAGLGMALCNKLTAEGHLRSGRLIAPFDFVSPARSVLYASRRQDGCKTELLERFVAWLRADIASADRIAPGHEADSNGVERGLGHGRLPVFVASRTLHA